MLLFNLPYMGEKRQNPQTQRRPSFFLPTMLGCILTVLDAMRIQILMVLFIIGVVIYWVFSIFLRK